MVSPKGNDRKLSLGSAVGWIDFTAAEVLTELVPILHQDHVTIRLSNLNDRCYRWQMTKISLMITENAAAVAKTVALTMTFAEA